MVKEKNKRGKPLETVKDLNSDILDITMRIKDRYPELSKYIEEMSETIPDEKSPQVNLKSLKEYYNSLTSLLNNYLREHTYGFINNFGAKNSFHTIFTWAG